VFFIQSQIKQIYRLKVFGKIVSDDIQLSRRVVHCIMFQWRDL